MSDKEPKNLPLPWCRLYAQEFLVDEKFLQIAFETGEHVLLVRGVYIMLMCLAAKTRERDGKITISEDIPMRRAQILHYLDLPTERAEPILHQMEELKMIARPDGEPWAVINFADRNPPSDGLGAWYTKKWRDKKKEEAETPSQPPRLSAKDKKGTKGKEPSQGDNTPATRLVQIFVNETGFWPPADPGQCETYWENPIRDWLLLANGDEDLVEDWMRRAIQRQRNKNYVFSKPSSIDGAVRIIANEVELKKLWAKVGRLMVKHGPGDPPKAEGQLAEVIDRVGGWASLSQQASVVARKKFAEAYYEVANEQRDKGTS